MGPRPQVFLCDYPRASRLPTRDPSHRVPHTLFILKPGGHPNSPILTLCVGHRLCGLGLEPEARQTSSLSQGRQQLRHRVLSTHIHHFSLVATPSEPSSLWTSASSLGTLLPPVPVHKRSGLREQKKSNLGSLSLPEKLVAVAFCSGNRN